MMDLTIDQQARRKAESMRQFAGGAPTFQYGEYRAWEQACNREQHRTLTAPDAYAARGGWLSGRDAQTITYHAEYGEVSRVRVSADMLK